VTLSAAASRESALAKAVKPARAAVDNPIGSFGDFTMADVMLTMRPNRRARIPGVTAWINKIGASMLASIAVSQAA
jgi:hypothetical protein